MSPPVVVVLPPTFTGTPVNTEYGIVVPLVNSNVVFLNVTVLLLNVA